MSFMCDASHGRAPSLTPSMDFLDVLLSFVHHLGSQRGREWMDTQVGDLGGAENVPYPGCCITEAGTHTLVIPWGC